MQLFLLAYVYQVWCLWLVNEDFKCITDDKCNIMCISSEKGKLEFLFFSILKILLHVC
jgi:hypothetical protein